MSLLICIAFLALASVMPSIIYAGGRPQQNSWPQEYPGMPKSDYGPEWQSYFQVKDSLPNVTWSLPRSWAGNIPVQRVGHPNNTLFFWAFESSNGSFTENSTRPWGIWLNGGPGGASSWGLLFENGPIHILSNYSVVENEYAWSAVADFVWIDQPVGTGLGTVEQDGYVADEEQLADDFMHFLHNFVKVFPHLATRPLILCGESYAAVYILYISKAYFQMDNPPINLTRIAIGNGAITSLETHTEATVISVLQTYPQLIGYDPGVYDYFQEQSALCGYNLSLQYPQPEHFPSLRAPMPEPGGSFGPYNAKLTMSGLILDVQNRIAAQFQEKDDTMLERAEKLQARDTWRRDLAGRANGTIDPLYLCDLYNEMVDYAVNFSQPWSFAKNFNLFNIPDALNPNANADASVFLNDPRTRAAIHAPAPATKDWEMYFRPTFAPTNKTTNLVGDASPEPMVFLTDLATNATAHNMTIIIYSGNDDSLVPHLGSQLAIQNTTFGGIQGFTRKPETPWYNKEGEFAGIVHQERNWKYVLIDHAGHLVAYNNPVSAYTLVQEFIFGDNPAGLVATTSCGTVTVVGGEVSSLGNEILTGQAGIYYGSGTTASTYFYPTATVEAWNSFIATATARIGGA